VQLGDFHSLDRLGPELVLVGGKAGLVQLAGPRLVQLQLDLGAQGRAHVVVGHRHQLVQLMKIRGKLTRKTQRKS
jgi:hypothetical protein